MYNHSSSNPNYFTSKKCIPTENDLAAKCKDPGYKKKKKTVSRGGLTREDPPEEGRTHSNCAWMKACPIYLPLLNH